MSDFKVTVKGKEYKGGLIYLIPLQRANVLAVQMYEMERKLGLLSPQHPGEEASPEAIAKWQKESDEYLASCTPGDEKLYSDYKAAWLTYCRIFIPGAPEKEIGIDTLRGEDIAALQGFFVTVRAASIENLKPTGITSSSTEQKAA